MYTDGDLKKELEELLSLCEGSNPKAMKPSLEDKGLADLFYEKRDKKIYGDYVDRFKVALARYNVFSEKYERVKLPLKSRLLFLCVQSYLQAHCALSSERSGDEFLFKISLESFKKGHEERKSKLSSHIELKSASMEEVSKLQSMLRSSSILVLSASESLLYEARAQNDNISSLLFAYAFFSYILQLRSHQHQFHYF